MPHRGFELTSSRSGVRRSNQIASWPVELVFISGGFYNITQTIYWKENNIRRHWTIIEFSIDCSCNGREITRARLRQGPKQVEKPTPEVEILRKLLRGRLRQGSEHVEKLAPEEEILRNMFRDRRRPAPTRVGTCCETCSWSRNIMKYVKRP